MPISKYGRELYVRPINEAGGRINIKTETVDVTAIQTTGSGFHPTVLSALRYWRDEGYRIIRNGQPIQIN